MKALLTLAIAFVPHPDMEPSGAPLPIALLEPAASNAAPATHRDAQHDFDFSIGTWRTEVRVLKHPLSGSDEWVDYAGTSDVREIWDGRANMVELEVAGPAGRIVGLSLRLYDPQTRQWSLHYANSRTGALSPPVTGALRGGQGEFLGTETLDGREVLVKFVILPVTPEQWRYEQSFSDDGGATWETNWIAIDTLVSRNAE